MTDSHKGTGVAPEAKAEANGNYEVGYGKPPKHTRFAAGRSGNPKGRPRGSRNLTTLVSEELAKLVPVREGGKVRKVSKREALIAGMVNRALQGDTRATQTLLPLVERSELEHAARAASDEPVSVADDKIITEGLARMLANRTNTDE